MHSDCVRGFPSHLGNLAEKQTQAKKTLLEISFLKELEDVVAGQDGPCPCPCPSSVTRVSQTPSQPAPQPWLSLRFAAVIYPPPASESFSHHPAAFNPLV